MIGYLGQTPGFGFTILPTEPLPSTPTSTATATLVPSGSSLTFSRQQLVGRTGVLRGGTVAAPVRLAETALAPPPPPPQRLPGFGDDVDPNAPQDVGPAESTGAGAGGGAPSAAQILQATGAGGSRSTAADRAYAAKYVDSVFRGGGNRIYGMTPTQFGLAAAGTVLVATLGYFALRKKRAA